MTDTVFSGPLELGLAAGVFLLAYIVYSLFGFGSGLIAVGLLAMTLPVADVSVLLLLTNTPVEIAILVRNRRSLNWKDVWWVVPFLAVGVPVGGFLLGVAPERITLGVLGVFLVFAGLGFLAMGPEWKMNRKRALEPGVGLLSGLLGGLFGTAGPPLILYFQAIGLDKYRFRLALLTVFHVITWLRLATYTATGLLTKERLVSAVMMLPVLVLGVFVGSRLHVEISEIAFRRAVSAGLVVLGSVMLATRVW